MLPSPALEAITLIVESSIGQSMMISSTWGYSSVGFRFICEGGVAKIFNRISRITSAGVFLDGEFWARVTATATNKKTRTSRVRIIRSARARLFLSDRDAVGNRSSDKPEAFYRAARFAWQRDNQRIVHHCGEVSRNDRVRRDFHRLRTHDFSESRQFDPHNRANRLRRHV